MTNFLAGANSETIVDIAYNLRKTLKQEYYSIDQMLHQYALSEVTDCFQQDASLGGYVPHIKKSKKRKYFV